jgi:Aspartyl protease
VIRSVSAAAAVTATLLLACAVPAGAQTREPHVFAAAPAAPRYVRVYADVTGSGVRGTSVWLIDRATGRTFERVDAGPLTTTDGFDGKRAWHADATGLPIVIGNAESRRDALAWAHLFGRTGPERPRITPLSKRGRAEVVRLRYPGLTGPIDVAIDRRTHHVTSVLDQTGVDPVSTFFGNYRSERGAQVPYAIEQRSPFSIWRFRVRTVTFPRTIPANAFALPPAPDDARLDGVTSVPMRMADGAPVVPIRIDGGPVLHVLFDSGSTNYLTPAAARRLHLRAFGEDKSGGVGPLLVRQRYTTVHRLEVGAAELRDQPFGIIDDAPGPGIDGAIGQEVLQRFVTSFDFAHGRVRLARNARALGITARAIALRFAPSGPEVDGALDGLRGAIALDTGSGVALDVMSPFVRKHGLARRYRVHGLVSTGGGIGGATIGYFARARTLRVGDVVLHDVPIVLGTMTTGALADPTQLGNLGTPALRNYVTVFDYRNGRLWLLP